MTTPNGSAVGAALAAIVQAGVGPSLAAHNAPAPLGRPRAVFSTGVPFLDLDPLPTGSLVDVDGPSGVGKTAFLHHIAAHALAPPDAHCMLSSFWMAWKAGRDGLADSDAFSFSQLQAVSQMEPRRLESLGLT
jgi:RecA/RadA recombinase